MLTASPDCTSNVAECAESLATPPSVGWALLPVPALPASVLPASKSGRARVPILRSESLGFAIFTSPTNVSSFKSSNVSQHSRQTSRCCSTEDDSSAASLPWPNAINWSLAGCSSDMSVPFGLRQPKLPLFKTAASFSTTSILDSARFGKRRLGPSQSKISSRANSSPPCGTSRASVGSRPTPSSRACRSRTDAEPCWRVHSRRPASK